MAGAVHYAIVRHDSWNSVTRGVGGAIGHEFDGIAASWKSLDALEKVVDTSMCPSLIRINKIWIETFC